MEFFAQLIIEFLLVLPGAFIRWIWFGRKKKFFEFTNEDKSIYNYILSFFIILVIIMMVIFIKRVTK